MGQQRLELHPQSQNCPILFDEWADFYCTCFTLNMKNTKHQTPIANLSITNANMQLKEQIRKFLKAIYPFDQDLCPGESIYQRWANLDQDCSNDTQPLAVCNTLIK